MSLFDLPQSSSELISANQGTANAQYRQITATRNVGKNAFGSNGTIQFRFETGGTTWFVPDKSYFRIRCTVNQVRADAGPALPPLCKGGIAPAMGLAANLFKTVEVQQNGKTIERVGERLPQIDALKNRMCKSKIWMDSIGKTTNFWDYDFNSRRQAICSDGYEVESKTWDPVYQTVPLTQVQAGFLVGTMFAYLSDGKITATAEDMLNGKMAVRPGDIFQSPTGQQFRVLSVIDPTSAAVQALNVEFDHNQAAIVGWKILKIKDATRNDAIGSNQFELIWQPPLGFFDLSHGIPPGGTWTIEFDPENVTQFKQNAVESLGTAAAPTTGLRIIPDNVANSLAGDFDFSVDQMYFYMYTVDAQRFENGQYFLDIQNVRCQLENMNTNSTGLIQKNFDVSGKTTALTLAFQDQSAGSNTVFSRSKFKIRNGAPSVNGGPSSFLGQDLQLRRFYINYNNFQKPQPDFDGQYLQNSGDSNVSNINQLMQRYADTMIQAGAYHTEGGAETFTEWLHRGPYYHFLWPKDAAENSTRVNINFQFAKLFEPMESNHTILLFNWWRTAYHIVHRNGVIDRMSVEGL